VLAAFVVVPVRWLRDYGRRHLTEVELRASVAYYYSSRRWLRPIPHYTGPLGRAFS
jgi:hypothetical protein